MSFLSTTKLVSRPISFLTWPLYFFDVLLVALILYAIYFSIPHLGQFSRKISHVDIYGADIMLFGTMGVYGFRIAQYIAIFRNRRMPQKIEWIVTISGLVFALIFYVFGGWMVREYAASHGYHYCFNRSLVHAPDWVFVRQDVNCPPAPSLQQGPGN